MLDVAPRPLWIKFDNSMRNKHEQRITGNIDQSRDITTLEEDASADTSGEEELSVAESTSKGRSSSRLPPRSRTGCWTCRRRKVKCDEKHPICGQCSRLQQVCDYEPHFEFRYDTSKQRAKRDVMGINETRSPPWDRTARQYYDPRASRLDDMPAFQSLNSEEERERKAAFHHPGTYHVVADQGSFASLPEYGGRSAQSDSTARTPKGSTQVRRSPSRRRGSLPDPNVVILDRFEAPIDRSSQSLRQQRFGHEPQEEHPPGAHSQPVHALQQPLLSDATAFQHQRQTPVPFYNPQAQAAFHTQHHPAAVYGTQYYTATQLSPSIYSTTAHGYQPRPPPPPAPPYRRSYTQTPTPTGTQFPTPPLPSRHLSMSLTSGSGSVLEEIGGVRGPGYIVPNAEESIEEWEEELYGRQR